MFCIVYLTMWVVHPVCKILHIHWIILSHYNCVKELFHSMIEESCSQYNISPDKFMKRCILFSSKNSFNSFFIRIPPFLYSTTILVKQNPFSSDITEYDKFIPISRSIAAKFLSHLMCAQLNVKNNWNAPKLSNFATFHV